MKFLALAVVAAALSCFPAFGADPKPKPKALTLEQRLDAIDARLSAIEAAAKPKPAPAAVLPAPSVAVTRPATGHSHTCANGHTWDHSVTSGHNCPVCGLSQFVQDSAPRLVTVAAAAETATRYSTSTTTTASGCSGAGCNAVPQTQTGWYPGKLAGKLIGFR